MAPVSNRIILRLRLIGRMGAWTVAGESILPRHRETRALLAVLALAGPRPVPRGWLTGLLWSRLPVDPAHPPLRHAVRRLSEALAPAGKGLLLATRDSLSLRPAAIRTDFEQISGATPDRPAALSLLDGELLEDLNGIDPAFDAWLRQQREHLRDRARTVAEAHWLARTEPEEIIAASRQLLFVDPGHEAGWRSLMRAHTDLGQLELAGEAFEQCRAALSRAFDTEPAAETRALLAGIRAPEPAPPPGPSLWDVPRVGPRVGVVPITCVGLPESEAFLGSTIAREISSKLSRFFRVVVADADTLARFVRDNGDEAEIRHALGIDYLMSGTIQRDRGRLRASLRLLDLREDNHVVWAERFERPADDLAAAVDNIAAEAVARIEPELQLLEATRNPPMPGPHVSANDMIMLSIPPILRMEREGFMRAGENLERGVALEPNFCDVHGWYAFWHVLLVSQGWAADPASALRRGGDLAERAVVLNPVAVRALTIAGLLRALQRRPLSESASLYDRALEVNPNLAMTWALSAVNCYNMGDIAEAERRYETYKLLSPHDRLAFFFDAFFAPIHLIKRDYQAAIATGRTVMQLNPAFSAGYKPYLAALGHSRNHQEAASVLRRLLAVEPNFTIMRFLQTTPIRRRCDREHFVEGLRLAGVA
jgi:DNA-binding SARP family transcriptional activator/TolB-like protein